MNCEILTKVIFLGKLIGCVCSTVSLHLYKLTARDTIALLHFIMDALHLALEMPEKEDDYLSTYCPIISRFSVGFVDC